MCDDGLVEVDADDVAAEALHRLGELHRALVDAGATGLLDGVDDVGGGDATEELAALEAFTVMVNDIFSSWSRISAACS